MVGGADDAFAAVKPVFTQWASKVVHAGEPGAGTRMKLARNLMHFVAFTAASEAQRLAEAAGLDLLALGEVVRHTDALTGGPGAIMHRDDTTPLAARRLLARRLRPHPRAGREGPAASRSRWPTTGVDVPLAELALQRPGRRTRSAAHDFDAKD